MEFKGQAEAAAVRIVESFKAGTIPAAMAQVFIKHADNLPSSSWSFNNRLLMIFAGTSDARGFNQWKDAGRSVKKGSKALYILGPIMISRENKEGKKESIPVAFKGIPVFTLEDTEGQELAGDAHKAELFDALPFVDVAKAWGIKLDTFNGRPGAALGHFSFSSTGEQVIALGVQNASTWAHEMIHAADLRRGTLAKGRGQKLDNEVVAELGGAVILSMLGHEQAADIGGAWEYISAYAAAEKKEPAAVCMQLVDRVAACVALILDEAQGLKDGQPVAMAA